MRPIRIAKHLALLAGSSLVSLSAAAANPSPIPEAELVRPALTTDQAGYCSVLMDRLALEDAREMLKTAKKLSPEEQQAQLFVLTAKATGRPVLEPLYKDKLGNNRLQEFRDTVNESTPERRNDEFTWCAERVAAVAKNLSEKDKEALKERVAGALMTTLGNAVNPAK